MLDPYRMVIVNLIGLFILAIGTLIYKFVYPKKTINLSFLLILISILTTISIFRNGVYESGDFNIHLYRTISFYQSLSEGNLMPSWAGDLNANYGYPLFIFNYSLPYYIISLFHFLGITFITSMKIFLASSMVLSGVFMYLFSQKIFKNNLAAFVSGVFYVFAPYHLIDLHFKVVIGEILFFTLLPLTFIFVNKLRIRKDFAPSLLFGLSFTFLIASHVVLALFSGILIFFYLFLYTRKKEIKILAPKIFFGFLTGGIASLYIWLTPFFLTQYTFIQRVGLHSVYFPGILELLYSPYFAGFLFQGPKGEISNLIGYTQLFVLLAILFLLIIGKLPKQYTLNIKFWLFSSIILIFLITPYSKFIWEAIPFIKATGSHRLLVILAFCISILAGYFTIIFRNKKLFIYLVILLTIASSILNWGQRRMITDIDDNFLKVNLWKSTSEGEGHFYANSKWVSDINHPWFSILPTNRINVLNGSGEITNIQRLSTKHLYSISAKTPLVLEENTLYFPGWEVKINGEKAPISPTNKGTITFKIPQGKQLLQLKYEDIFIYKLLKIISLIGLLFIISYVTAKRYLFKDA